MKAYSLLFAFSSWFLSAGWRSGRAWPPALGNTGASSGNAGRSEKGFLLLLFLPFLVLALTFLAGSLRLVQLGQQRIAMQSRLDLCSLHLIQERKRYARELDQGNRTVRITGAAVAMARGLKILAGPAGILLGSLGEAALVRLNQATARWQDARTLLAQAAEWKLLLCGATPYNSDFAFCTASPGLRESVARERALFPDLAGPLELRAHPLLRVRCRGKGGLEATRKLSRGQGGRALVDMYEK